MVRIRPRHAASLVEILRPYNRPGMRGAEVGVLAGETSRALLRHLPHLLLWMVDSWCEAPRASDYYGSGDAAGRLPLAEHLANLQLAFDRTSFASDRRLLVRSQSLAAAAAFPDNSLDFVFIDADHTYEAVRSDIAAWAPKVRPGGIIAGHDYGGIKNRRGIWGVNRAVSEYASASEQQLRLAPGRIWWLAKKATPAHLASSVPPITAVRIVFGDIAENERLRKQIELALRNEWARDKVVHVVAGTANAIWLQTTGAKRIELVCEEGLLPQTAKFGKWYMKTYLVDQAMALFGEVLYLDFDARILRIPDETVWKRLRIARPTRFSGSLQAQNVGYRRPVCLPIHRDRKVHSIRRCLNLSVLYCRDRRWMTDWLAAYEDAARYGIDPSTFHDETFLQHAIDSRCGVLDAETMVTEFEIPIAQLKRNTPEAKARKCEDDAYFWHR